MTRYTIYELLSYMWCRIWKTVKAPPKTLKVEYTSCVAAKIFLLCFFIYIYIYISAVVQATRRVLMLWVLVTIWGP